jgi:hypothetical protein
MGRQPQQPDQQRGPREAKQRLQSILRGAFDGPPTPLKEIPTRNGRPRSLTRRKRKSKGSAASASRAKTA